MIMIIGFTSGGLLKTSGVDRTVFEIALSLAKNNECHIFTLKGAVDEELRNLAEDRGIQIHELAYGNTKILRRYMLLRKYRILKNYNLDVIVSNDYILGIMAVLAKIPLLRTYYGHGLFFSTIFRNPLRWLNNVIEDLPQVHAAKFNLPISKFCEYELKKIYGTKVKSRVIYLGVNLDVFKPQGDKKILPEKSIVFVGKITPSKGIHLVMRALKMTKFSDVHLFIIGKIGSRDYYNKLQKYKLKNVHFLGTVPFFDLPKYYRGSYLTISGTKYDYFNLPFLESQACGTPVIGFDKAAIPEVVNHKKTGLLCKNLKEMSSNIKLLLENPDLRNSMGKNAIKWVRKFNWENTAKNYEKVLKEAVR